MTKKTALDFKAEYIAKGARDFTKPSHFELDPAGFFEPHVEAVKIEKADVHFLQGGTIWFRKETLDTIASAAGVSFRDLPSEKHVRGEPYVGRSQAITQGPDGQPVVGDVAEYEFDPVLRAEEDLLRAQVKNKDYKPSEVERRLKVLEYEKAGHQRANTGARSRATISAVGMQTGFKDLFQKGDVEFFLFSRVIINVKNKMVAEMQLSAIGRNVNSLYGPQGDGPRRIEGTVHREERPAQVAGAPDASDFAAEDPEPTIEALRAASLTDLLDKYSDKIKPAGIDTSRRALADGNDENILLCLNFIKDILTKQGINLGGQS